MAEAKFLRTDSHKYSKLGVRRKNKQVYRKSKGRDNKIRLNMKGHLRNIRIGFRTAKKERNLVNGKKVVEIHNLSDLNLLVKDSIGIVAKVGNKMKLQIAEKAEKNNLLLYNLDIKKFKSNLEKKLEKRKELRKNKKEKKMSAEKKASKKKEETKTDEKKEDINNNKKIDVKNENTSSSTKENSGKSEAITDKSVAGNYDTNQTVKTENKREIQTNNYGRGK